VLTKIEWSELPSWIGVIAVVIGALTFAASRRDAHRALASKVFVFGPYQGASHDDPGWTNVEIHNNGDAPIFDCSVSLYDWGERRRTWRARKATDWWSANRIDGRHFSIITPTSRSAEDHGLMGGLGNPPKRYESLRPPVILIFRDGNGRRRVRWPDGRLTRKWRQPRWT
jgi:hypothetical protein